MGGWDSIFYPALEMAAMGFETLAVTDCLNFANPEKQPVMTDFVESLAGMNQACAGLTAPIISGNVSFYNETLDRGITPTPATGLVGLRPHVENLPASFFQAAGEEIYLLSVAPGWSTGDAGEVLGRQAQWSAPLHIADLAAKLKVLAQVSAGQPLSAVRAVGSFGLGVTLARMTLDKQLACEVRCEQDPWMAPLYQLVVVLKPQVAKSVVKAFADQDLLLQKIGEVKATSQMVWNSQVVDLKKIKESYAGAWSKAFPELS